MLLISVIVPIFNVENYLEQCIESIISQTYKNLEIILVNDGSTDNSLEICKRYELNDERIYIINRINGGAASARNAGLNKASGDYICFIDGDDYWSDEKGLEKLVNIINEKNVDMINFHYRKFSEYKSKYFSCFVKIDESMNLLHDKKGQIEWLFNNSQYIASSCNKLVKRELAGMFREDVLCEDIEWSFRLLIKSMSIYTCNFDFYVYRQRKGSITHSINDNHINDLLKIIKDMIEILEDISDKSMKDLYMNFISYQYSTLLINIHYTNNIVANKYINQIKELVCLLDYDRDLKVHKLNIIFKFLGFNILYVICGVYAKVRK